jgi:hypothetical protein
MLAAILLCSMLAATGCRGARPDASPAPLDSGEQAGHAESAALICEAQTPVATWQRRLIAASPCTGGRTCEQAWDDLSRLTDQLLLFRCERVCGNGELWIGDDDIAGIFDSQPHPRHSYVRFDLDTDAGTPEPAFLLVQGFAQVPVEDSYALAGALAERLEELELIREPQLVPSDEATAMLVVHAAEQQRLAEERRPIEGMSDDEQDTYAISLVCGDWTGLDAGLTYPEKLDALLDAHPILEHTAFPRVLSAAHPAAQLEIAATVAERTGQGEACAPYLQDLDAWVQDLAETVAPPG